MGKRTVHLNDVTNASPYDSCTEINVKGLPSFRSKLPIKDLCPHFLGIDEVIEYSKQDKDVNWEGIRAFSPKDCLILSYENVFLKNKAFTGFVKQHDFYVGYSEHKYRVIVLRDAFNLFASQYRATFVTPEDLERCVQIYKQYAEIFLDSEKQKEYNVVCANYNKWFLDADYRMELAARLGIRINGDPFEKVPTIAGGSSFDGTNMDGRAQKMKVLERWQKYREDPNYRAIFKDIRLVDLSDAVFGPIVPVSWWQ